VRSINVGALPQCNSSANIDPVNSGPEIDDINELVWMYKSLHLTRICLFLTESPLLDAEHPAEVAAFHQLTGQTLADTNFTFSPNSNYASFMAEAKSKNCDGILNDGTVAQAPGMVQALRNEGLDIPLVFSGSEYIQSLPAAIGRGDDPVYSISEMAPFTPVIPEIKQYESDLKAAGVGVNSLSEYGWEAANIFGTVLKSIKGPITLASVNKALLATKSLNTDGMTGSPFSFGPGSGHTPNRSGKMVEVKNGTWSTVSNWIVLPKSINL
jgi:branched-chain amino acid transport system substrate-binding protein